MSATIKCEPIYFTSSKERDMYRDIWLNDLVVVSMQDVKGEGIHRGMYGLAVTHKGPRPQSEGDNDVAS